MTSGSDDLLGWVGLAAGECQWDARLAKPCRNKPTDVLRGRALCNAHFRYCKALLRLLKPWVPRVHDICSAQCRRSPTWVYGQGFSAAMASAGIKLWCTLHAESMLGGVPLIPVAGTTEHADDKDDPEPTR